MERVFVSADADAALTDAARRSGLIPIAVRSAASACLMATVTGTLGDAPGGAFVAGGDPDVARVLVEALRDRAPAVVVASGPSAGRAGVMTDVVADGGTTATADAGAGLKGSFVVAGDSAAQHVEDAMRMAMDEPRGPVWLVVESAAGPASAAPDAPSFGVRSASVPVDPCQLDEVVKRVSASQRPVIVAGRECRTPGSGAWLRAFAEALPAPVLVTPAARGVLPDPHPLAFGLLRADAEVLARADLVVALGVDPLELDTAGVVLDGPVVRVGRARTPRAPATAVTEADVPAVLEELAPRLRDRVRANWDVAELDRLRRAMAVPAVEPALATLVTRVREAMPAGAAAVFSRALEPLAARWPVVGPDELVVADPVVAAAIAVALARPEHATVAFAGAAADALAELATAAETRARVIVLLVDAGAIDGARVRATGARLARPLSLPALVTALGSALDADAPTVIAVPAAR